MTEPVTVHRHPVVFEQNGGVFADSRDVAACFERNHRDVLRAIDLLMVDAQEFGPLRNFAQGSYTLPQTGQQKHRCFTMDRDGFALLAMGFTGPKALQFKLRYIAAFNEMEAKLREKAAPPPVTAYQFSSVDQLFWHNSWIVAQGDHARHAMILETIAGMPYPNDIMERHFIRRGYWSRDGAEIDYIEMSSYGYNLLQDALFKQRKRQRDAPVAAPVENKKSVDLSSNKFNKTTAGHHTKRLPAPEGAAMSTADTSPKDELLSIEAVMSKVGLRKGEIYARMGRGEFPVRTLLGPRTARWSRIEVDQWISDQLAARSHKGARQ